MKTIEVPLINPEAYGTILRMFEQSVERHEETIALCAKVGAKLDDEDGNTCLRDLAYAEIELLQDALAAFARLREEDITVLEEGIKDVKNAMEDDQ